jgi:hypothetical protein
MKRRDLINRISAEAKRQGITWDLDEEGADHSKYRLGAKMIPVPRHREIGDMTTRRILNEAAEVLGERWWR